MQKYYPILYSTPMVEAILDGRKTQTRRIIKMHRQNDAIDGYTDNPDISQPMDFDGFGVVMSDWRDTEELIRCPYGGPGSIGWVREKWRRAQFPIGWPYHFYAANDVYTYPEREKWKPSIHMPKEATRLFVMNDAVRGERLTVITPEDAIAEGIRYVDYVAGGRRYLDYTSPANNPQYVYDNPVDSYRTLWEVINGRGSWEKNPFVWVVTSHQHEVPQEQYQAFRADFLRGGKDE